jgi:holin-like protein
MGMGKKIGIFCLQLFVLIAIYQLGNQTVTYLQIKIPGNVVGMIILFCLLWLKIIKIHQIQFAANWLLKHLGFFFIPISVGLMTLGPTMLQHGISILFVLSISAIIGLVTAGRSTQSLIQKREEVKTKTHDHSI